MTVLFVLIYWMLPVVVLMPYFWFLLRNMERRSRAASEKWEQKLEAYRNNTRESDRESDRLLQEYVTHVAELRKIVDDYLNEGGSDEAIDDYESGMPPKATTETAMVPAT